MKKLLTIIFCLCACFCNAQIGLNGNVKAGAYNWASNPLVDSVGTIKAVRIIRWPGGLASNDFDWKTGYADGTTSGNRNNLDDLKNAADKLNANVMFVLNMITHDLAYNMEMLRTAQAKGIAVKYIEMGNEVSNGGVATAYFGNGANYADTCKHWIYDSIKVVFPDALCGVWSKDQDSFPTWNSDIRSRFTPDAFVTHYYPPADKFIVGGVVDTVKIDTLIERSLRAVELDSTNTRIPVWITETNVHVDSSFYAMTADQYETALSHIISYYRRNKRITILLIHNVVGDEGTYDDSLNILPTGVVLKALTPTYTDTSTATIFARQRVITMPVSGYDVSTVTGLLWLPPDYNPALKYPLIISMGGNGQTTVDSLLNVHGCAYFIANGWNATALNPNTGLNEEFIVWSPAIYDIPSDPRNAWFNAPPIKSQLNYLEANYSVDTNKVFPTGLSAGGYGTLAAICDDISLLKRFAAAAPVSAVGDTRFPNELDRTVTYNIPTWFTAGAAGDAQYNTCVQYSNLINTYNPPVKSLMLGVSGGGHNNATWDTIYNPNKTFKLSGGLSLYSWFLKYSRTPVVTPNSIHLNTPTLTYCVTNTSGTAITVTGTSTGVFSGNVYSLELSSQSGSFISPTVLGFTTTNNNTFTINGTIPAGKATGNTYQIRVHSNGPDAVSNTITITINLAANVIAPATTQTIAVNAPGAAITVTNTSTPLSMQWYRNDTAIAGATSNSYTPLFANAGTYIIKEKSTFTGCGVITSNTVTINVLPSTGSTKILLTKNQGCGIYFKGKSGVLPGDTLELDAAQNPYCYITIDSVYGTEAKPVEVVAINGAILNTGSLKISNSQHVHCNFGTQPNLPTVTKIIADSSITVVYGYESNGYDSLGGAGFEIRGKAKDISFSHFWIHNRGKWGVNAGYAWQIKNDPFDYKTDTSFDYPNTLSKINISYGMVNDIQQDAGYIGFSGGYNLNSQFISLCNCYPRPTAVDSLDINHIYFKQISRSAIQLSQTLRGTKITFCMYENVGYSNDNTQGAFVAIGSPQDSTEIAFCRGKLSFKPAVYTKNYGTFNLHDNVFDSSGYIHDTLGILRTNPNVGAVELYPDSNTTNIPLRYKIQNNRFGKNTSAAGSMLFFPGKTGNYATTGNVICNNIPQTIYHAGITLIYDSTACGDSSAVTTCTTTKTLPRDTCCKIVSYTHDTTITKYYDSVRFRIAAYYKNKWHRQGDSIVPHVPYQFDTTVTHDSAEHFLTTPVDTTICVTTTTSFIDKIINPEMLHSDLVFDDKEQIFFDERKRKMLR